MNNDVHHGYRRHLGLMDYLLILSMILPIFIWGGTVESRLETYIQNSKSMDAKIDQIQIQLTQIQIELIKMSDKQNK
jgi:hypothetical protein